MNWRCMQLAVQALAPIPPHGIHPWVKPGGNDEPTTEAEWNALRWNPPHHADAIAAEVAELAYLKAADPAADAKPAWAAIAAEAARIERAEAARIERAEAVHGALRQTREACERLIATAYGAHDSLHEVHLRMAGNTAGDAERTRLVARYKAIKKWLYPASWATVSWADAPPPPADATAPDLAGWTPETALAAPAWPPE